MFGFENINLKIFFKMKKTILLFMAMGCIANPLFTENVSAHKEKAVSAHNSIENDDDIISVSDNTLSGVYQGGGWASNWFITAQGGISAFIGKPVGHGDLFDRTTPMLHLNIGKWVTPTIGLRLSFEGFKFKDMNTDSHTMQNIHADLMYNLSYFNREDVVSQPKLSVSPFVGLGIIHNSHYGQKPFALSFGINIGYRLSERLQLTAEAGNTITWQNFDGVGASNKLGDNLLRTSVGFTYNIGKVGWSRVIDARPYILAYDQLNEQIRQLRNGKDKPVKCKKQSIALSDSKSYPKNDYKGLNDLRERIRNKNKATDNSLSATNAVAEKDGVKQYDIANMTSEQLIAEPIFFFFKVNTAILTDESQVVNIEQLAHAINKYNLQVEVVGAADAKTGTKEINRKLSRQRASFLKNNLIRLGVNKQSIIAKARGGISDYDDLPANRHCCVKLTKAKQTAQTDSPEESQPVSQ